jgi:Branched-chain amino acid ABC-type transport system, permease components
MRITIFIQQVINGLALGSVYALLAIGYSMVYGLINLVNFAHGSVYMVGAFVGLFLATVLGLPFAALLVVVMVTCAVLGVLIEKVAYKPLRNSPKVALFITAIGMSMVLENGLRVNFLAGPNPWAFPTLIEKVNYEIAGISVSNLQILTLTVVVFFTIALQLFIKKTKIGYAMRVVSYDRDAAALMGINVNKIISITFAIGSALAGVAGVLVGMMYPKIDTLMGVMPGLKAFVAAIMGGIGLVPAAMFSGLFIGLTEAMTKAYVSSRLSDAISFIILILILIFKPEGLFGKKKVEKV